MRRIAVVAACVLVVTVTAWTAPALGAAAPGNGPRPGYTIVNPPRAPLMVGDQPTEVLQGTLKGAGYIIEVPPNWNGELVMWAHGYRGQGYVLTVDPPAYGLREHLVNNGYAWAASSYDANGYDVESGVRSTHDLAQAFRRWVGHYDRLYLAGVSMGGHVTGRSIEDYPNFYDGALPMCGVLGDVELFDFFLDYQLVAQALAGLDAYPIPANYQTTVVPQLNQRLGLTTVTPDTPTPTNPLGVQFRDVVIEQSGGQRPGDDAAFANWKNFLFGLPMPDNGGTLAQNPGRVAQNVDTQYGPDTPVDVDAVVERVGPADPSARRAWRLDAVPRITGTPRVPVLTLHDLGDLFVPFSMEQYYAFDVAAQGRGELLVQRAIRALGHCEFSRAEVTGAFDDLVAWVEQGERPAGDVVTDPVLVAAPDYGCQFSDPTATGGTRRYFAPCP